MWRRGARTRTADPWSPRRTKRISNDTSFTRLNTRSRAKTHEDAPLPGSVGVGGGIASA
jgi:hypothetical protein